MAEEKTEAQSTTEEPDLRLEYLDRAELTRFGEILDDRPKSFGGVTIGMAKGGSHGT